MMRNIMAPTTALVMGEYKEGKLTSRGKFNGCDYVLVLIGLVSDATLIFPIWILRKSSTMKTT